MWPDVFMEVDCKVYCIVKYDAMYSGVDIYQTSRYSVQKNTCCCSSLVLLTERDRSDAKKEMW
jgi:hypothetical protein